MSCTNTTETCPPECIRIDAHEEFVDTGVDVAAGETYSYTATGNWCDWYKQCDADGYPSDITKKLLERFLREPGANWFCLIGSIDRQHHIILGKEGEFTVPVSGRLFCFANDIPIMIWNNKGCVCLKVWKKTS